MNCRDHRDAAVTQRAISRLVHEIRDGLRHGHFDFTVSCEVIGQGRRRLQLHAGKTYQYEHPGRGVRDTDDHKRPSR